MRNYVACVTYLQYRTSDQQRKNELFDHRYDFYRKMENQWLSTTRNDDPFVTDIITLIPLAQEARFIFDDDIADHILSLEEHQHIIDFFPDSDFIKPFKKNLSLR